VPHHHAARVARQALRRSSWNAWAPLEDGLARRLGVRQDLGIDVDHDLVALPRGAGIEALVQGRLGQQRQGVGLLLLHRRRVGLGILVAPALIQGLAGRVLSPDRLRDAVAALEDFSTRSAHEAAQPESSLVTPRQN
jgi:hypothetical protein